jgi:hypothetical protein
MCASFDSLRAARPRRTGAGGRNFYTIAYARSTVDADGKLFTGITEISEPPAAD